jgi:uncharacterized OB-fold protein
MAETRPNRVRGPGHDDFWAACAKGELRLQRCGACGRLSWPVTRACEHCGSDALSWERMSGRGRLASWCAIVQDYYRGLLPLPWPTILIELEEGAMFVSNPHGFGWDDFRLDLPVKLAFIDCEDDAGPFRLPVFERLDGAP